MFSKLALGHAFIRENKKENWVQARAGDLRVGDSVRIKFDAFTGDKGTVSNGRLGKVVAVRFGDIIVKSTDGKTPELNGVHYSPDVLEKLQ